MLLPSIDSSDDEIDEKKKNDQDNQNDKKKQSKRKNTKKKRKEEDDNEEEDDDEILNDFEFGGILGEDGGSKNNSNASRMSYYGWALDSLQKQSETTNSVLRPSDQVPHMATANLIAAKRKAIKQQQQQKQQEAEDDNDEEEDDDDEEEEEDDDEDEEMDEVDDSHREFEKDNVKTRMGNDVQQQQQSDDEEEEDENDEEARCEAQKAAEFFDKDTCISANDDEDDDEIQVFTQLPLSRPLLRGVAAMGFVKPTPIQAAVIPIALAGRDVCASAVTGSGKTAAFALPLLERIHQTGRAPFIKAVILTPTRELAAQILGMMSTFAQYLPKRSSGSGLLLSLIVGGSKNVAAQAIQLKTQRPDIVVATPGRLLDHVTNSTGVDLESVQYLVLDEADRLLDLGFTEQVLELIKTCGNANNNNGRGGRQTMLFSATMTTKVDELIKLGLKRPVRIQISTTTTATPSSSSLLQVAPRLQQEFVRVRVGNEGLNREAMLLALLTRTFAGRRIMVFLDTKVLAHRMMILCGLCGIVCMELHGNLTQVQRLEALDKFNQTTNSNQTSVLLATDLAARGLDIWRVDVVINFEMPTQMETYIHRIGRTARAGRGGTSCTLIGEGRRHLMKAVMKDYNKQQQKQQEEEKDNPMTKKKRAKNSIMISSRTIPPAVVTHFANKIRSLEPHIKQVLDAEAVARMDRLAEMEAIRAENIIQHADEIKSRPQRQWHVNKNNTATQQQEPEQKPKQEKTSNQMFEGTHRMNRKKRRAREARMEQMEMMRQEQEEDEEGNKKTKKKSMTDQDMKILARAQKRTVNEKEKAKRGQSIADLDERDRERREAKRAKKVAAAGDGNLFDEEYVLHSSKKNNSDGNSSNNKALPSTYHFRGYDPSKEGRKNSKRKSNKSFKSRSKYKRRK